jgi:hypothetical protein
MRRVLVPLVIVLLAGCAGASEPDVARPRQTTVAPVEQPTQEVAPTPTPQEPRDPGLLDFSVPAVGGGQVEGAALAGPDAALWFWAPW